MQQNYSAARTANALIGLWLFISAFLWPHSMAQLTNTWIMGAAIGIAALIAFRVRGFRFVNTAFSIWLFISAFALPTLMLGTAWNNAIVAIVTFVLSLVGSYAGRQIGTGAPRAATHG